MGATINVDARAMGIGVVIRNNSGEVKAALSNKITGLFYLKMIEVKALGITLVWAKIVVDKSPFFGVGCINSST